MRTQGEDDAKTRFRISLTSSEKTDSQIYRLKENRPQVALTVTQSTFPSWLEKEYRSIYDQLCIH